MQQGSDKFLRYPPYLQRTLELGHHSPLLNTLITVPNSGVIATNVVIPNLEIKGSGGVLNEKQKKCIIFIVIFSKIHRSLF